MANRSFISGNTVVCQVGLEDPAQYARAVLPQFQIRIASEDFKYTPSKKQEGVLTGSLGSAPYQTMGIKTENTLSFLARPDDVGIFLKAALGIEFCENYTGNTGYYIHRFTPIGNLLTDYLPSLTFKFDKRTGIFTYPGNKINTIKFSAAQEDFLMIDVEMIGDDEVISMGNLTTIYPSKLRAFTFNGGEVYYSAYNAVSPMYTTKLADITSINFSYSNNLEAGIQTTSSGMHYKEPQPNLRDISGELEVLYNADNELLRQHYFKKDDTLSMKLQFIYRDTSNAFTPYLLNIYIPCVQFIESGIATNDVNGMRQSISWVGYDDCLNPPVVFELINKVSNAYTYTMANKGETLTGTRWNPASGIDTAPTGTSGGSQYENTGEAQTDEYDS